MLFIFLGAIFGLIFSGMSGLILGAGIGYLASIALRQTIMGGLQVAQAQLIDTTFSIMGALSKADNVVTRDEILMAERMFTMLRLSDEQRERAKTAFREGKSPHFNVDAAVERFAAASRRRAPLVQLFLQLQCMAVAADGSVHPAEHEMLVRIARQLGLSERDVAQLEALLRATAAGPSAGPGGATKQRLADAYAALGVSPDANPDVIKRAYRRLISQNHPDKLAARGLPESMRPVAEERSREINAAYDLVKTARKIN